MDIGNSTASIAGFQCNSYQAMTIIATRNSAPMWPSCGLCVWHSHCPSVIARAGARGWVTTDATCYGFELGGNGSSHLPTPTVSHSILYSLIWDTAVVLQVWPQDQKHPLGPCQKLACLAVTINWLRAPRRRVTGRLVDSGNTWEPLMREGAWGSRTNSQQT